MTLTTTTHPLNLLVAGGGFGGLAAYVLGRAGHAVMVLEQAATYGEIELFQSGKEPAGFAGLKCMYDGIDLNNLFAG